MGDQQPTHIYPQEPVQIHRPHILNLLAPLGWSVLMLLPPMLILVTLQNFFSSSPMVALASWLFGGVYLIFVVSYFMMHVIFWYLDAWLIRATGLVDIQLLSLFNRRISELSWSQVQDVRVSTQGLLATLFNFGDVTVQSAGRSGVFELRSIPHASEVAKLISELASASQQSRGTTTAHDFNPSQRLGEILIQQGNITPNELTLALQEQRQTGKRLGQIMVSRGFISREDLVKALGHQYHIPLIDLSRYDLEPAIVRLMPYESAVKYHAIPVHRSPDNVLSIAISQPSSEIMGELMSQFDLPLTFLVADEHYIQEAIAGYYADDQNQPPSSTPLFTNFNTSGTEDSAGE